MKRTGTIDVERRRRRKPVDESEARTRRILDAALDAFVIMDPDGLIIEWNRKAETMFGWTREEAIGRRLYQTLALAKDTEKEKLGIYTIRHRDGREMPVEIRPSTIPVRGGRVFGAFIRDVSERLRLEDSLRRSEAGLRRAQSMAKLAYVVTRPDGSIESWSNSLQSLIGMSAEEMPKSIREWLWLLHGEDRSRMRALAIKTAADTVGAGAEYRLLRGDGEWIHLRQVCERIDERPDAKGRFHWFCTLQDVTGQKAAEDAVRRLNADLEQRVAERTEELEAANKELGAFDYSISHDLRAPLRWMQGFAAVLREEYGERLDERGHQYLRRIDGAAQAMNQLIEDFLSLSMLTRGEFKRMEVDVTGLAVSALGSLQARTPARSGLFTVAPGLSAFADRGLVGILLENLLGNAWKFTARREITRIEAGAIIEARETIFFVRDNGVGFEPDAAARLFEPFQREHRNERFEGSGIGLATVRRIVRRHGGRVWAEGRPDEGAVFFFTLAPAEYRAA